MDGRTISSLASSSAELESMECFFDSFLALFEVVDDFVGFFFGGSMDGRTKSLALSSSERLDVFLSLFE